MDKMIEVSRSALSGVLPLLEEKLERAENALFQYQEEVAGLKETIAEWRAKLNGSELPLANGEKLRQRLPKGYGEKAIFELLKSLPEGQGLTMSEIKNRTGVKHATVYRTLTDPKRNKGRFTEDGKLWKLVVRFKRVAEPSKN